MGQPDRQTFRETDRQTDRPRDRQTEIVVHREVTLPKMRLPKTSFFILCRDPEEGEDEAGGPTPLLPYLGVKEVKPKRIQSFSYN